MSLKAILVPKERRWVDGKSEKRKDKHLKWDSKVHFNTDRNVTKHKPVLTKNKTEYLVLEITSKGMKLTPEEKLQKNTKKNSISPTPRAKLDGDGKMKRDFRDARKSLSAKQLRPQSWNSRSSSYQINKHIGTLPPEYYENDAGDEDNEDINDEDSSDSEDYDYGDDSDSSTEEDEPAVKARNARLSFSAQKFMKQKKERGVLLDSDSDDETTKPKPKLKPKPKTVAKKAAKKPIVKKASPKAAKKTPTVRKPITAPKKSRLSLSVSAQRRMQEREAKRRTTALTKPVTAPKKIEPKKVVPVPEKKKEPTKNTRRPYSVYDFNVFKSYEGPTLNKSHVDKPKVDDKDAEVPDIEVESMTEKRLLQKAQWRRSLDKEGKTGQKKPAEEKKIAKVARKPIPSPPYTFSCDYEDTRNVTVPDKSFEALQKAIADEYGGYGMFIFFQEASNQQRLVPVTNQASFEMALTCTKLPKLILVDTPMF
eukprot:TRINITY_DN1241_c0_g1_i3.p1 TRINITY_DN1241_c0_g1~~TRINITY_DN1241_c0_g1_i3.p1  ORF type:complete len:480 (-),score=126.18 TRINITY_DN1241_c0_g1_i3:68-1507(-)